MLGGSDPYNVATLNRITTPNKGRLKKDSEQISGGAGNRDFISDSTSIQKGVAIWSFPSREMGNIFSIAGGTLKRVSSVSIDEVTVSVHLVSRECWAEFWP